MLPLRRPSVSEESSAAIRWRLLERLLMVAGWRRSACEGNLVILAEFRYLWSRTWCTRGGSM